MPRTKATSISTTSTPRCCYSAPSSTSLVEHNTAGEDLLHHRRGRQALSEEEKPYRRLMRPESRPPLVIAVAMQVFHQFTGINAMIFYAPVLF